MTWILELWRGKASVKASFTERCHAYRRNLEASPSFGAYVCHLECPQSAMCRCVRHAVTDHRPIASHDPSGRAISQSAPATWGTRILRRNVSNVKTQVQCNVIPEVWTMYWRALGSEINSLPSYRYLVISVTEVLDRKNMLTPKTPLMRTTSPYSS